MMNIFYTVEDLKWHKNTFFNLVIQRLPVAGRVNLSITKSYLLCSIVRP